MFNDSPVTILNHLNEMDNKNALLGGADEVNFFEIDLLLSGMYKIISALFHFIGLYEKAARKKT